jgi:hypothetical protein
MYTLELGKKTALPFFAEDSGSSLFRWDVVVKRGVVPIIKLVKTTSSSTSDHVL